MADTAVSRAAAPLSATGPVCSRLNRRLVKNFMGRTGMSEEKRAELYTSPGGRFIRADTLPRILAHWRSLRRTEVQKHFIKYDGELYVGDEVDKLQT
jgi:hypothetical protein